MPEYLHQCTKCEHKWEDFYSIKEEPPKFCPECHQESVKRLISLTGKGIVELTGQEIVDKVKADAKQLAKDASQSEKIYSNLIGEGVYEKLQTQMDKRKR